MKYALFTEMALSRDLPEHGLRRGDVVRLINDYLSPGGREGYSIEVCNAVGDTIAVTEVEEAALEPLSICPSSLERSVVKVLNSIPSKALAAAGRPAGSRDRVTPVFYILVRRLTDRNKVKESPRERTNTSQLAAPAVEGSHG